MGEVTMSEMALRLGLAMAVGLVLGYEREQHGRAAGLRTTMLVCVSSAVVMVLSQVLGWESALGSASARPDPARLAAGVLAGMGFLGAGVIIRQDNAIHGVTTAAVLWFSAILGMAFGAGHFALGFAGFSMVFLALFILPFAEARIQRDRYVTLSVWSNLQGPSQDRLCRAVEGLGLGAKLRASGLEVDNAKRQKLMQFEVKLKNSRMSACQGAVVALVAPMKGVQRVLWS